ncbi:ApeA N-terminal domain 1-containing protein [Nonomuraea wenchangensis]
MEWTLPGQTGDVVTLKGNLVLQADRPPRGNAYGNVPLIYEEAGDSRWVPFPQTYRPSLVTGRLLNGLLVILVDPVVALWTGDRATIHARAALVGRTPSAPTTIRASQMTMQVTGLDAISGIGPLRQFKYPQGTDGRQYLDWAWEAVGRPESTQKWSDGSAEVELWFRNSFNVSTAYHFRLAFSPVVQVTFSEPLDFDTALNDWATPLCNLVALSTGRLEKITYLDLQLDTPGSQPATLQVYGLGLHQRPHYSDPEELQKARPNFFLADEDTGLLTLLRRWQKLTAEHHPLLETYASLVFVADQHPRSRFQLLIQAIEGLHGVEMQEDFVSRSLAHGERRAAVLEEAAQVLGADSMKFLKKIPDEASYQRTRSRAPSYIR